MRLIHQMIDADRHILIIDHQDLISFDGELATIIFEEYYKCQDILNSTLTHLAHECEKDIIGADEQARRDEQKEERYQIAFDSSINANDEASVRELKCNRLGKLICFKGTITRTSEVRPELVSGIFKCKNCGSLSRHTPQQFKYTEPKKCYGHNC